MYFQRVLQNKVYWDDSIPEYKEVFLQTSRTIDHSGKKQKNTYLRGLIQVENLGGYFVLLFVLLGSLNWKKNYRGKEMQLQC